MKMSASTIPKNVMTFRLLTNEERQKLPPVSEREEYGSVDYIFDLKAAERFLAALDPTGKFTFQTFDDNADRKDKDLVSVRHGSLIQFWNSLCTRNAEGAGIYVTINETDGKGREAKNVKRVRAVFVDFDKAGPLPTFHVKPHIIVESSRQKWHAYWLVKDCPLDQFEALQKRFIAHYGSDSSVHDLSRVMRLPGFFHRKVKHGVMSTPFRTRLVVIEDNPGGGYTIEELAAGLPAEVKQEAKAAQEDGQADQPAATTWTQAEETRLRSALAAIPTDEKILAEKFKDVGSHKIWINVGRAIHRLGWGEHGFAIWRDWSAQNKMEFNEKGLRTQWASFGKTRDNEDKPVTIGTVYWYAKQFGWNVEEITQSKSKTNLFLTDEGFIADFTPPDYLIGGLLQRRFLYSLTGPTGSGKTAIVLLLTLLVSQGRPLGNREIDPGKVLFLAGENPDDVRMRWIKLREEHGLDAPTGNVIWRAGSLKLSDAELRRRIMEEIEKHGPFALIIVDTSAAFFEGDDENSNVQLGNHARTLRSYIDIPGGPTILVTCHPIKNYDLENLLPRGGGAFLNEVDGNLVAIKKPESAIVELYWHGKFRGADFASISFELVTGTSERLKDSKGNMIRTITARQITADQQAVAEDRIRSDQNILMAAMVQHPTASMTHLAMFCGWLTSDQQPNKSKVQRLMSALKREKLVENKRGVWVLTAKGRKENGV
jgi:hypothetical protein